MVHERKSIGWHAVPSVISNKGHLVSKHHIFRFISSRIKTLNKTKKHSPHLEVCFVEPLLAITFFTNNVKPTIEGRRLEPGYIKQFVLHW